MVEPSDSTASSQPAWHVASTCHQLEQPSSMSLTQAMAQSGTAGGAVGGGTTSTTVESGGVVGGSCWHVGAQAESVSSAAQSRPITRQPSHLVAASGGSRRAEAW
jgi:hypothetical protein